LWSGGGVERSWSGWWGGCRRAEKAARCVRTRGGGQAKGGVGGGGGGTGPGENEVENSDDIPVGTTNGTRYLGEPQQQAARCKHSNGVAKGDCPTRGTKPRLGQKRKGRAKRHRADGGESIEAAPGTRGKRTDVQKGKQLFNQVRGEKTGGKIGR